MPSADLVMDYLIKPMSAAHYRKDMNMELTEENKKHIDSLSHYDLLEQWRFAPVGDSWFQGETGQYWSKRMSELKDKNPGQAVANSKALSSPTGVTMAKKDISKLWYLYLACCAVLAIGVAYRLSRIALNYPEPFTPHSQEAKQ